MDSIMGNQSLMLVVFLVFFLPPMVFFAIRVKAGHRPSLRPIAGFEALKGLVGQSAETGQPLHVSLGVGGIASSAAADTLAGLTVLEYLARQAAASDAPPVVTVADPSLLLAAQDVLRHAYLRYGDVDRYDSSQVRFIAPEPIAYAAGVMGVLGREELTANIMVGFFGDEYLLMGETGARKELTQIVGASDPQTLPFVLASTEQPLIGEEMYAAGAYLSSLPTHVGSLIAQDVIRVLLVLVIVIGVIYNTVL